MMKDGGAITKHLAEVRKTHPALVTTPRPIDEVGDGPFPHTGTRKEITKESTLADAAINGDRTG